MTMGALTRIEVQECVCVCACVPTCLRVCVPTCMRACMCVEGVDGVLDGAVLF